MVGDELLSLWVGIVGLVIAVAALTIAIVLRVHHMRGFSRRERISCWAWIEYSTICTRKCRCYQFYYYHLKKDAVVDNVTPQNETRWRTT
jgi:hypothetical protein